MAGIGADPTLESQTGKPGPEGQPGFGDPLAPEKSPAAVAAPATGEDQSAGKNSPQISDSTARESRQLTPADIGGKQKVKDHMAWKLANTGAWGVRKSLEFNKQMDSMQDFDESTANDMIRHIDSQYDTQQIAEVTDKYDALGKKMLDEAYAPFVQGSTKANWSQIPKSEQYAAAAFSLVTALRGGAGSGARAINALARPLSLQEQENAKKQQQDLENEGERRKGIVEQFKMLMGDKSAAVQQLDLAQRERASEQALAMREKEAQRKQDEQVKASGIQHLRSNLETDLRSGNMDATQRVGKLDQFERDMQDYQPGFKVDPAYRKIVGTPTQHEAQVAQRIKSAADLDKIRMDQAAPKLKALNLQNDTLAYKLKNILPWTAKEDQERYIKDSLAVEKARYQKDHGWVTGSQRQPKPTTPAQLRASLNSLLQDDKREEGKIDQELVGRGLNVTDANELQNLAMVKAQIGNLLQDHSPQDIEKILNLGAPFGLSTPIKSVLPRMIAVAAAQRDHEKMLRKVDETEIDAPADGGNGPVTLHGDIGKGEVQLQGGHWVTTKGGRQMYVPGK